MFLQMPQECENVSNHYASNTDDLNLDQSFIELLALPP